MIKKVQNVQGSDTTKDEENIKSQVQKIITSFYSRINMFKNYFKTAIRNLRRNKSYAFINVLGLTVGIAASLLIFLVIQFETSFDTFHKKKDNIYRVGTQFHTQDGISYSNGVAFPVGPALRVD